MIKYKKNKLGISEQSLIIRGNCYLGYFLGVLSLFISLPILVSAQDFQVSGVVTDEDGVPVENILIILYDADNIEVESDTTDAEGSYDISVLATGLPPEEDTEIDSDFRLGDFYPNPSIGQSTLPIIIGEDGSYMIYMYSVDGRLIQSVQSNLTSGTYHINVNMPLAAGMYFVQVVGSAKQDVRKITSLLGTGAEISISAASGSGSNMFYLDSDSDENQLAQTLFSEALFTLVAYGGETFQDYEVEFDEPGTYVHNITMLQDSDPSHEACSELQLTVNSALPTQFVTVEGMKPEFGDEPFAWLYDMTVDEPGEDDRYPAFIEWIEDEESEDEGFMYRSQRSIRERILSGETDQARVAIPLHPGNHMNGGEAGLVIESEDQEIVCDTIPITIEPLEPAPGIIHLVVDELEDALISRAEDLGSSYSELITAEAWNLTADLAPVAAGLQAIDGPGNPNNIRAILSGDAPAFDEFLEGEYLELIETIYQITDLAGSLLSVADVIDELPSTMPFPDNVTTNRTGIESSHWEEISVDTPEELHYLMDAHSRCANANQGPAAVARLAGGLTLAGAAFLVPGAQAAAGFAGLTIFLMEVMLSICEESFPNELSGINLNASPLVYNEDQSTLGEWSATIFGYSDGYTLSWPDALGLIPGMGQVAKITGRLTRQSAEILELADQTAGFMQDFMITAWGMTEDGGPVNFPPGLFGPVMIETDRDEEYFSWELITLVDDIGDHPFVFDEEDENYYHPNAPGISRLRLETQPGKFLNQSEIVNLDLEVKSIEISITDRETGQSPDFFVEPGEFLELEATVSNADDPSISWEHIGFGTMVIHGDGTMLDYIAPEDGGVELLIATSEATGGARDNDNAPVRSSTARVNVTDELGLFVYPDLPCLELDQTHDFTFAYQGQEIELAELEWDMSGPGSLGSDGSFVPIEEGEVTLTFYHPDDPDDVKEISFAVREICSFLTLNSYHFQLESECVNYLSPSPVPIGDIRNSFDDFFQTQISLIGDIVDAEPPFSTNLLLNLEPPPFWSMTSISIDGMQFGWVLAESGGGVGFPLQIERKMRTVDGQELPAWYGRFVMPFENADIYHETGNRLETIVIGEFSGVLEGEHGCFDVD